jgi:hypothetical protein
LVVAGVAVLVVVESRAVADGCKVAVLVEAEVGVLVVAEVRVAVGVRVHVHSIGISPGGQGLFAEACTSCAIAAPAIRPEADVPQGMQ